MYEDIFAQIAEKAKKKNLKESTIKAYCTSVRYFLRYINKTVTELNLDDVDMFLTQKRLSGISPDTYNHYHSGTRFL